jgi:mannose-6-phosphate isomerase-like protein (cupin superfamily)
LTVLAESVRREGFAGPFPLLTPAECRLLVDHVRFGPPPPAGKALAASDRLFFDLATRPSLLETLGDILGADVVLWGATLVARRPGDRHAWHCDLETALPGQRAASVWVGLENTSRESSLKLISRSHDSGKPVQQALAEHGIGRDEADDGAVLGLARELDPRAELAQPDVRDGQALVFDGRLWHGSDNSRQEGRRVALLLQYAAAGTRIESPDPQQLGWPFRFSGEQPPAVLVSGRGEGSPNRLVPRPPAASGSALGPEVRNLSLPLDEDPVLAWRPHPQFAGATPNATAMACHVSVLGPGHSPHALHAHLEEELLVVLDGEAEVAIADHPFPDRARTERLGPGDFVYHPAYGHHTIRNPGAGTVTYLMLKWRGEPSGSEVAAGAQVFRTAAVEAPAGEDFARELLFEAPTAFLARLHAHLTVLQPGAGYPAHEDQHDVAILPLAGRVRVRGHEAGPRGVLYLPAGHAHDMESVGEEPARYLVFEFQAARAAPEPDGPPPESERDRLARELHTVLSSSSWRITAPLRRAAAALRR